MKYRSRTVQLTMSRSTHELFQERSSERTLHRTPLTTLHLVNSIQDAVIVCVPALSDDQLTSRPETMVESIGADHPALGTSLVGVR
jgi:hypothetical protein